MLKLHIITLMIRQYKVYRCNKSHADPTAQGSHYHHIQHPSLISMTIYPLPFQSTPP